MAPDIPLRLAAALQDGADRCIVGIVEDLTEHDQRFATSLIYVRNNFSPDFGRKALILRHDVTIFWNFSHVVTKSTGIHGVGAH